MVVPESEMIPQGEVESPLQTDPHEQQQMKNQAFSSLGRQSSIYSLTLDEFQNTLSENGKNFGSMNMDEFLNSIWTAEENQSHHSHPTTNSIVPPNSTNAATLSLNNDHELDSSAEPKGIITKQASLPRQGSLTLPPPLSRKTVDEVWAEIHGTQQRPNNSSSSNVQNPGSNQERQITFGEMTLEDFLVRAGVVREQCQPLPLPLPLPAQQQRLPFGAFYQNNNHPAIMNPDFAARPVMSVPGNVGTYQALPHTRVGDVPEYGGGGHKRKGQGSGGGFRAMQAGLGVGSPVSPVSSNGLCGNPVDTGNQYGMRSGGRKRIIDGPIEKVVERRRRRMIKNRESAARSRARKQAYTVELEAELNLLKEENDHLKKALADLEIKRMQQGEEAKTKGQTKAEKANEKLRMMRRSNSSPY